MVYVTSVRENTTELRNVFGTLASAPKKSHIPSMLHLVKLAVGIRDIAHLAAVQKMRAAVDPPLRHQTRSIPRRAAEILDGGSIYWVIQGAIVVRQRIVDILEERRDDGTKCAGLVLDPALVPVEATRMRAFQGWRYFAAADAPPDLKPDAALSDEMPAELRRALRDLSLL